MSRYVLLWNKDSDTYMSEIEYLGGTRYVNITWGGSVPKDQAIVYDSLEEAKKIKKHVNKAVIETYWDYDDIPPDPIIERL